MFELLNEISNQHYSSNFELYKYLHQNPELSNQEFNTASRVADELENIGVKVTRNFWGNGFVGILKNGAGPTLMIRTDLDALPIKEKTSCKFESNKTAERNGEIVHVMHACGHDMHMTVFVGTAKLLTDTKNLWNGTVIFLGQPAEEIGQGAKGMIASGLFEKFPKPDAVLAYHIAPEIEAGKIGYVSGYCFANVDMIDLTVFGIGGHGASPHKTKDPIVLTSKIIMALQTITSRELSPLEPAVVSIGSIHGGTSHNIIPSNVKLELTARSYTDEVRNKIIESIKRISIGIAKSEGLTEDLFPKIIVRDSFAPAVYNDPDLITSSVKILKESIGKNNVIAIKPEMIAEDFAYFGRTDDKIPITMLRLGIINTEVFEKSRLENKSLPSLHSPHLFPDTEPSIKTGIVGMASILINMFKNKSKS